MAICFHNLTFSFNLMQILINRCLTIDWDMNQRGIDPVNEILKFITKVF